MVEQSEYIWMDGTFVKWDEANVHVLTHALHYGTGVFEGIRCYETPKGPAIFRLKEHVDRLFYSAETFNMQIPFTKEDVTAAIHETISKNGLTDCYIRPLVYLGVGPMGLNPVGSPVKLAIAAWKWGAYLGDEGMANGIRLITSTFTRNFTNQDITNAKISGNYVNSILAKHAAVTKGYDEALMLTKDGAVSECTGENVFVVKDGIVYTTDNGCLPGITRDCIKTICKKENIPFEIKEITRDDIFAADEFFLTGTAAELTPVRELDDKQIGSETPGPITKKLQQIYLDAIHGKIEAYNDWLTFLKKV